MAIFQLIVYGLDVSDYMIEIPTFAYRKGDIGQMLEIPSLSIPMDNSTKIFSPGDPVSIFPDPDDWYGKEVLLYRDGDLFFKGVLRNITQNGIRLISLDITSELTEILNKSVLFFQTTTDTPATIMKRLLIFFGINYDPITFQRAHEQQEDIGIQCRANITFLSDTKLIDALQWLCDFGLCRFLYLYDTIYLYFEPSNYDEFPSIHTFQDNEIIAIDSYNRVEYNNFDGYSVETQFGTASQGGANIAPSISGGPESPFVIPSLVSGFAFGEHYLTLNKKSLYTASIFLDAVSESYWLRYDSVFSINSVATGIQQDFTIASIDKSNPLGVRIEVYSV